MRRLECLSGRAVTVIEDAAEAWAEARHKAGPEDMVCATGSIYLVGEILKKGSLRRRR
jgi:folylpolyglutamate synthase/dihydropteroate synthase